MHLLFDQGTPVPLRHALATHEVATAFERRGHTLQNGELLAAAEEAGFDVLITTDRNLRYQQNLADRRLAIVVLPTTDWRRIRRHAASVASAVELAAPGAYTEVTFPP